MIPVSLTAGDIAIGKPDSCVECPAVYAVYRALVASGWARNTSVLVYQHKLVINGYDIVIPQTLRAWARGYDREPATAEPVEFAFNPELRLKGLAA